MFKYVESKRDYIKNFSPSWFASVMGTGIVAKTSFDYSAIFPILRLLAEILYYFNIALFFFLLIPWFLRWFICRKECINDLDNPIMSNFYPTITIGAFILSINFLAIGHNFMASIIFWVIGVIGTFFFGFTIPYKLYLNENIQIPHITPAWFIPPVGFIIIPVSGSILMTSFSGILQEIIIFINYISWGSGFFQYIALLAIWMYRFMLHKELPTEVMPTIWVNLGPIGVGVIALFNLVIFSPFITLKEPFLIMGFLFWGFGIWWLIMAFLLLIHYIVNKNFSFTLSWWAFVFPLGAYVASTHVISLTFNNTFIDYIGYILYWCLLVLWSITLVFSIVHTFSGRLFTSKK
ncbi:MAG: tellurite-resistance/dicarboxylate transporter [Promethearchaeota archaeon]